MCFTDLDRLSNHFAMSQVAIHRIRMRMLWQMSFRPTPNITTVIIDKTERMERNEGDTVDPQQTAMIDLMLNSQTTECTQNAAAEGNRLHF